MKFAVDNIVKQQPIMKESINSTKHPSLRESEQSGEPIVSVRIWSRLTDYFESSRW